MKYPSLLVCLSVAIDKSLGTNMILRFLRLYGGICKGELLQVISLAVLRPFALNLRMSADNVDFLRDMLDSRSEDLDSRGTLAM